MRTPQETYEAMKQQVASGLRAAFPVEGASRKLELVDVHFGEMPAHDDWNGQKDAALANRTWGAPVRATLALKDAAGKTIDRKLVGLGMLPTPTVRHTFIVDGREYQVSNQRRLRPGFYSKVNRLGQAVGDFNLSKGRNFSVVLDPADSRFEMKFKNTHIPLAPVLKGVFGAEGLGLGKAFDHAFTPEQEAEHLRTLYAETHREAVPEKLEDVKAGLRTYFNETTMDRDINEMNLGHGHEVVNAMALQDAAKHVLAVHKREAVPTDKDQLAYAEIHGVEDFMGERLVKNKRMIHGYIKRKLDRVSTVAELNAMGAVAPMLHGFFASSSLANTTAQINPLEMAENAFKITSMGEGGISDTVAVPNEVRAVHPSQHGFVDPVRTPDNAKAGVDIRATLGAKKVGKTIVAPVVDAKTGQKVMKSPQDLFDKVVAHDKEPVEHGVIRAIQRGQLVEVKAKDVDYYVPTEDMFTVSTAIVPFVPNSHAHRVAMGAKMLAQALSLNDREVPLVDTTHSSAAIAGMLPTAPVAGTVTKVEAGVVTIKGADGKSHKVNYAHDFPLNGGSFLHTDLTVKAGDAVKAGQVLGDNNFTRSGQLALGKNLNVAFVPFKGMNYEDGITITESGAAKLTSQHQFLHEVEIDPRSVHDKKRFLAYYPAKFENAHLDALDEHGVVKVGTRLAEGAPIMAMLRKRVVNPEQLILGKAHKSLMEPFKDNSLLWDKPYEGVVTAVKKTAKGIKVTVKAEAPAIVGDKLAGRYGNKGVITAIVPDHEAPRTADGRVPDVMLNSAGLNSRMNNGQIYEVIAGKALQAMGKTTEKFPQFMGTNTHTVVKKLVTKAGIQEAEEMMDGKTGLPIGKILMGPMYFLKLFKTADSGFSARSGGDYDIDMRPAKGGDEGAKSVGTLDFAALLAGGARHILRESATHKAEYNPEVFEAMWRGQPLPPPKTTFAFNKFTQMLQGMGVNVKKEGSTMRLLPMTDKDVLAMSSGQVAHALTVNDKEDPVTGLPFRPEQGGLFDHNVTGGLVGNKWSHITLSEPVVNPLFHAPARVLLGMSKDEFKTSIAADGGEGMASKLARIDPASRIKDLEAELAKTNSFSKRDGIHKQLRYLNALKQQGLSPADAYVLKHIPVVPPAIRPIYPDPETGTIVNSDANRLYQNLMLISDQLKTHRTSGDPETVKQLRTAMHDAVAAVQGLDGSVKADEKDPKGFLKVITGQSAKEGFFQSKLIGRRQDVAGRGVVVPDPSLGLDAIALPEPMAWKLFRNHVTGEMVRAGVPLPKAAEAIKEQTDQAKKALQLVMEKTPVLMSRAPSLHKFNVQAFKTQLTPGKSIRVNNLIHKGFNMDHDGDAVNVHVPLGHEAIAEAHGLLPSKNLFNPLNRAPVNMPTNETTMGLWKVTNIPAGARAAKKFASQAEAMAAFKRGEIRIDDPIEVAGL